MAHNCPDCESYCTCDGDDTFIDMGASDIPSDLVCSHECQPHDLDGDSPYDCDVCDDNGCALCLGDERAGEPLDDDSSLRGDRKAISAALVAPLFQTEKE